jgi:DNA-binding response OmpR family regulator
VSIIILPPFAFLSIDRTWKFGSRHTTEGNSLENGCDVLIVDAADETRDVLETALQRRGLKTLTASQSAQGLAMAQEHRPDLIVLDLEIDGEASDEIAAQFARQSSDQPSLVLLGSVRRRQVPEGEYVAKPYHFGPLIRRIEEILAAGPAKCSHPVELPRAG